MATALVDRRQDPGANRGWTMPNPTMHRTLASIFLAMTAACATAASPETPNSSAPDRGVMSTNRSIITDAEIPTTGTESAYDMIQRLRPEYLREKPTQTYNGAQSNVAPPLSVFFNGTRIGLLADLRGISAPTLSMVRYYNIEEGKRKFGMQYGGGVIELKYRGP
jgi:hypothetical protein